MFIWNFVKKTIMGFWYWYVRKLNLLWPSINVGGKEILVSPGVYKPLENEHSCAEYCAEGERVLDLGCGSGVGALFCAEKASEVVAVDISAAALSDTKRNCERLGVGNVTVAQSDMFSNVEGKFDLIVANPPYIEAEFTGEEEQFATSVRYLPMLFANVRDHLTDDGRLLIQFPAWFRGRIERYAREHSMKIVEVRRMPRKSAGLWLLSLIYLQVGFRSTYFLLEPMPLAANGAPAPSFTQVGSE